jgi:hypothetical protein
LLPFFLEKRKQKKNEIVSRWFFITFERYLSAQHKHLEDHTESDIQH